MFVDFVTLMLLNMTAGFLVLAHFLVRGSTARGSEIEGRHWALGFGVVGGIAALTGLVVTFAWPLPGSYNIAFGETSVLFGSLFLAAALGFERRLWFESLSAIALVDGLVAVVVGARIAALGMTNEPTPAAAGFILAGVVGLLVAAGTALPGLGTNRPYRLGLAGVSVATALLWAAITFSAYWDHLARLARWEPL